MVNTKAWVTAGVTALLLSIPFKEMDVAPPFVPEEVIVQEQTQRAEELPNRGAVRTLEGFEITWYNDSGYTYSGRKAEAGVTCAVDPKVIPLNSVIRITMPDGTQYIRRADDTGGAVKGRIVDIHADQPSGELRRRGRTYDCKVEILELGDGKAEWER